MTVRNDTETIVVKSTAEVTELIRSHQVGPTSRQQTWLAQQPKTKCNTKAQTAETRVQNKVPSEILVTKVEATTMVDAMATDANTTLFGTEPSIVEQTPEEKLSDTVTRCVHLHPLSDSAFELAFELNGCIIFCFRKQPKKEADVSHDVPPRRSFSKLDPDDQGFVALEKLSSLVSDLGDAVPQTDEVNHHAFLSHNLNVNFINSRALKPLL